MPGTVKLNDGAAASETSAEKRSRKNAMPCLPLSSRGVRRALSAGSDGSARAGVRALDVVSAGTLAEASSAALALAPPASDASGTGTLAAPGAAVGIATASLAAKLGAPGSGVPLHRGRTGRHARTAATAAAGCEDGHAQNGAAQDDTSHPRGIGRARRNLRCGRSHG